MTNTKKICLIFLLGLTLSACEKPEQKEARYLERGNTFFQQHDYKKARLAYRNAARIKPSDPEIYYRLGLLEEADGNIAGAFSFFTAGERQDPAYIPVVNKLAQYYLAADMTDNAAAKIETVLKKDPKNAEAHALNASLLLRRMAYDEAESEARTALRLDPTTVMGSAVLSNTYMAQNKPSLAIEALDKGLEMTPNNETLLSLKALIFEKEGDLDKLAAVYNQLFTVNPQNLAYWDNLSRLYLSKGRTDDAEATLKKAIEANPDNVNAKKILVTFLDKNRDLSSVEKQIAQFAQQDPNNTSYLFWLAGIYQSHDQTDKAIHLFQDIAKKNWSRSNVSLNAQAAIARLRLVKGEREVASKIIQSVLDKDPNNNDALFLHAHLLADQGMYQPAVTDLRLILRNEPHQRNAEILLSEVLLKQGYIDLALETMRQRTDADPLDLESRIRMAQIMAAKGELDRAKKNLDLVTQSDPHMAVAWENTARLALVRKDWPEAERAIAQLDAFKDQKDLVSFLRAQLKDAQGQRGDAFAIYQALIQKTPGTTLSHIALTEYYNAAIATNKLPQAEAMLASLTSKDPEILTTRGRLFLQMNKLVEAEQAFDDAILAKPSNQDPYIELAGLLIRAEKQAGAEKVLRTAMTVDPTDARAPLVLADLLTTNKRIAEAVEIYQNLLATNPSSDLVANNLAQLIADEMPNDMTALQKAAQIAERFAVSDNPLLLDTIGWVYFRQNHLNKAESIAHKIIAQGKVLPPQVHYHLGAILFANGEKEPAKQELQKALQGSSDYIGKAQAVELMKQL